MKFGNDLAFWMAVLVISIGLPGVSGRASADEGTHTVRIPKRLRKTGHRRRTQAREKETEGTEAPNRFKADTVIRSQYKLDGKPLEVDPD